MTQLELKKMEKIVPNTMGHLLNVSVTTAVLLMVATLIIIVVETCGYGAGLKLVACAAISTLATVGLLVCLIGVRRTFFLRMSLIESSLGFVDKDAVTVTEHRNRIDTLAVQLDWWLAAYTGFTILIIVGVCVTMWMVKDLNVAFWVLVTGGLVVGIMPVFIASVTDSTWVTLMTQVLLPCSLLVGGYLLYRRSKWLAGDRSA